MISHPPPLISDAVSGKIQQREADGRLMQQGKGNHRPPHMYFIYKQGEVKYRIIILTIINPHITSQVRAHSFPRVHLRFSPGQW